MIDKTTSPYFERCHAGSSASISARFKKHQTSGQALVEYVLVLSMAVALAIGLLSFFTGAANQGVNQFNAMLEQELRGGGFPEAQQGGPTIWEN